MGYKPLGLQEQPPLCSPGWCPEGCGAGLLWSEGAPAAAGRGWYTDPLPPPALPTGRYQPGWARRVEFAVGASAARLLEVLGAHDEAAAVDYGERVRELAGAMRLEGFA